MDDTSKALWRWVTFAGCVLVVVVLYWASRTCADRARQLLTFVLAPPVTWLQRWIGRIPAVLAMVISDYAKTWSLIPRASGGLR
jgi:hypothetical protein